MESAVPHRRALSVASSPLWLLLAIAAPNLAAQSIPNAITGLEITPDGGTALQILQGNSFTLEFMAHNGLITPGPGPSPAPGPAGSPVAVSRRVVRPFLRGRAEIDVTFTATAPGAAKITLSAIGGETGFVNITVTKQAPPSIIVRDENGHNQDRSLCLTAGAGESAGSSCGDLFVTHSMPVYRSLGRDRSLTLFYNSATATGLALVPAVISYPSNVLTPSLVRTFLMVEGSRDSAEYSPPGTGELRQVVLGRNLSALATGVHTDTLLARSVYLSPAALKDSVVVSPLLVVNRSQSEFGRGWSLAGLEQIVLATDTSRRVWVDGAGSIRLYHQGVALNAGMLTQSGLGSFSATAAVDGVTSTHGWNTDAAAAGAWLQADLGIGREATTARLYAGAGINNAKYAVEFSDNGLTWKAAYANFQPGAGWRDIAWNTVGPHRYWRLRLTNTPGTGSTIEELSFGSANNFYGAPGQARDSLVRFDTLSVKWYRRDLRHGSVKFDEVGHHRLTLNRVGARTTFIWTTIAGLPRLASIVVPPNDGSTRAYTFFWNGGTKLLDSITDPIGRKLRTVITAGQLSAVIDPDGAITAFGYSGNVMNARVVTRPGTPSGLASTKFTYQNGARLTSVKIPWGPTGADTAETTFTPWDERGLALGWAGQIGASIDTAGASTRIDGPLGGTGDAADFNVDAFGAPKKIVELGTNATTTMWHDSLGTLPGLVTKVKYPTGRIVRMAYDARSNLTLVKDSTSHLGALGLPDKVRRYEYASSSARFSPTLVADSVPGSIRPDTLQYILSGPDSGLLSSMKDRRGHRTTFTYLTGAMAGLVDSVTEEQVETWKEPGSDDVTDLLEGQTERFTYDVNGNVKTGTSPTGVVTSYVTDSGGRATDVHDPLKTRTRWVYDGMNRVTQLQQFSAASTNPYGIDPLGSHPAQGRACDTSQVVCADSTAPFNPGLPATRTTSLSYDAGKQLSSITEPRGVPRGFAYDAAGLALKETDDFGLSQWMFHSKAGDLDSIISRTSSIKVRYRHDGMGRRTAMIYPAVTGDSSWMPGTIPGDSVLYFYDSMNRDTLRTNARDTVSRAYYADGSLKRRRSTFGPGTDTVSYHYDAMGAPDTVVHGRDTTIYTYNSTSGDLQTLSVHWGGRSDGARTFSFLWDGLGRVRQITYPTDPGGSNNMQVKYRYDRAGMLRRLVSNHPGAPIGGTRADMDAFDFTFRNKVVDPVGRILRREMACSGTASVANPCGGATGSNFTKYQYNRMNMLTLEVPSGTTPDTMRYDASGNLIYRSTFDPAWGTRLRHTYLIDSTSGAAHNTLKWDMEDGLGRAPLLFLYDYTQARLSESPVPFSHDEREHRYYYDGLGRMSGYIYRDVGSGLDTIQRPRACVYDADGNLAIACNSNARFMSFDGANVSGILFTPDGTYPDRGWRFVHGPGIDSPLTGYYRGPDGNRILYWVTDGAGRQFAVADSSGEFKTTDNVADKGTWRYVGGTGASKTFGADRQSGGDMPRLSYFRNRAYDQFTGRWTQEDPIGVAGGLNLFAYAGNNPVSYSDPFGLCERPGGKGVGVCVEAFIKSKFFGLGDNRGPSSSGGTYKASARFSIDPRSGQVSGLSTNIGSTAGRKGSGNVNVSTPTSDGNGGWNTTISGSALNGAGVGPSIDFSVNVNVGADGGVTTAGGTVDGFPSYEIWSYGNGGEASLLYHFDMGSDLNFYKLKDGVGDAAVP